MCSSSKGQVEHGASAAGSTVLFCGSIPAARLGAFTSKLAAIEDKRTAKKEEKKQRTPAFLHALVLDAIKATQEEEEEMEEVNSTTQARGGFTDVGQHTGSQHRDTCWPLVREVIKVKGRMRPVCPPVSHYII